MSHQNTDKCLNRGHFTLNLVKHGHIFYYLMKDQSLNE